MNLGGKEPAIDTPAVFFYSSTNHNRVRFKKIYETKRKPENNPIEPFVFTGSDRNHDRKKPNADVRNEHQFRCRC